MYKPILFITVLMAGLFYGCSKSDGDCGDEKLTSVVTYNSDFFTQPSEIYWAESGGTRYYTYNWTFSNICPKSNPKVDFTAAVSVPNNTLSNPFSFDAGTYTCLGVQAQKAILSPTGGQTNYQSNESEIGMNQCFSGQSTATIYPYVTVSFTTLGSSTADSLYLINNIDFVKATVSYHLPQ